MRAPLVLVVAAAACGPSNGTKVEGVCSDALVSGDLVITEVFADFEAPTGGTGADEGKEWFEIYNASERPISLEGLQINHSRPDGGSAKAHVMTAATIEPGQYFTLGNATADLVQPYIDYGYSNQLGDFFNNDGGKLALACGDTEIDSATYEAVAPGRSRQLTSSAFPDYILNDDQTNWCEAADTEFEAANFGTPGAESDCAPVVIGACNDNGTMRPTVSPQPGELVITEIMPSPAGSDTDDDMEWFEAKALADFDLNGLALDRVGDTTNPNVIESPDCVHVATGDYVVFARNELMAENGGLPEGSVRGIFRFTMVGGSVANPGNVQILSGANVIDSFTWTDSPADASLALDPDLEDAVANDLESNYCPGTFAYGIGGLGTPGTANGQCVLLPPQGMCDDGGTIRPIVKPVAGQLVITEFLSNPEASPDPEDGTTDDDKEWFEVTNTGATPFDLNELTVTRPTVTPVLVLSAACIEVEPAAFALFARSTDATRNGGLPGVDATFDFALVNSGNNRAIQILDGETPIDSLTYTVAGSSAAGLSIELDPDHFTIAENDVANPTPGLLCQGTTPYGDLSNRGTPKAANTQCP